MMHFHHCLLDLRIIIALSDRFSNILQHILAEIQLFLFDSISRMPIVGPLPNFSGQDDVYSLHPEPGQLGHILPSVRLMVVLECCPTALACSFGLLSTFFLVPEASTIIRSDEQFVVMELEFRSIEAHRVGLLRRKFQQLTTTIEVSVLS